MLTEHPLDFKYFQNAYKMQCVCVCVYIYIYIYICMYVCIVLKFCNAKTTLFKECSVNADAENSVVCQTFQK